MADLMGEWRVPALAIEVLGFKKLGGSSRETGNLLGCCGRATDLPQQLRPLHHASAEPLFLSLPFLLPVSHAKSPND